uniref:Uncharacterized protein n=1 Tax=Arundo donax TaxID=35708 RepID=A0A0A9B8F0_ARUDO
MSRRRPAMHPMLRLGAAEEHVNEPRR